MKKKGAKAKKSGKSRGLSVKASKSSDVKGGFANIKMRQ